MDSVSRIKSTGKLSIPESITAEKNLITDTKDLAAVCETDREKESENIVEQQQRQTS